MGVKPAERDSKREQAFALSLQKVPYREIAKQLGINKSTVVDYVRKERQRRSHDRDAEYIIRDVVSILRASMLEMLDQLRMTEGTGPMAGLAKVKLATEIRLTARDLVVGYGVKLPKVDGDEIAMDRLLEWTQEQIDAPIAGYPDVSEDAIFENQYLIKSPTEIARQYRESKRQRQAKYDQRQVERETKREWRRQMEAEAELRGYSSVEEMLDDEEDGWFDAVDYSENLDDHYGGSTGGY
jgi:transposase-like protein